MTSVAIRLAAAALACLALAGCAESAPNTPAKVTAVYPHDRRAFTEGLVVADGVLYESTGRYGRSTLRRIDLDSGRIEQSVALAPLLFGEGLALAGDRLYQLTWKTGVALVYDRATLEKIGTRRYNGQGWGLTFDGRHLIMSNGSATLSVREPDDFSLVRRLEVTDHGQSVERLNELEYVDGEIWANIWYQDRILRIDPHTGEVTGVVDAHNLRARLAADADPGVLNGIAWDAEARRLFLTGKNWPALFEITPPQPPAR